MAGKKGSLRSPKGAPLADRIALHTERSGMCWQWTGATDNNGYGRLQVEGRTAYAHRVAYEVHVGPIPASKELDHLCRNRGCCNPAHLEPVTTQINVLRGESPGAIALRRTVCLHGEHLYEEHAYFYQGRRACRQCRIDYCRLWQASTHAERQARKAAGLRVVDLAAFYATRRQQERAA